VRQTEKEWKSMMRKKQAGFTLMETMISLVVLLGVSAIVMSGLVQMMWTEGTIANRTEMHSSVRSATELLQQEIGQAGKLSLPTPPANVAWAMLAPVVVNPNLGVCTNCPVTFNVTNGVNGAGNPVLFEGEWVTVEPGATLALCPNCGRETVQLTCPVGPGNCPNPSNNWNATFLNDHRLNLIPGTGTVGAAISLPGAFSAGIVPPAVGVMPAPPAGYTGYQMFTAGYPVANAPNKGSTGTVLKLFGDVNGDGEMVYVEYTCVQGTPAAPGFLYRNQIRFMDTQVLPPIDPSMIVLTGVLPNPNNANGNPVPCFTYQLQTKGVLNAATDDMAFVTDVAVTLTVQTSNPDPQTHILQQETKALLNVSPRNVYDAWDFATLDYTNRVQLTPPAIKANILINYQ
jgi:prepilin-type N-terminal cleavage/methylation domain-containing protein